MNLYKGILKNRYKNSGKLLTLGVGPRGIWIMLQLLGGICAECCWQYGRYFSRAEGESFRDIHLARWKIIPEMEHTIVTFLFNWKKSFKQAYKVLIQRDFFSVLLMLKWRNSSKCRWMTRGTIIPLRYPNDSLSD